jgi:hypothetical protein
MSIVSLTDKSFLVLFFKKEHSFFCGRPGAKPLDVLIPYGVQPGVVGKPGAEDGRGLKSAGAGSSSLPPE